MTDADEFRAPWYGLPAASDEAVCDVKAFNPSSLFLRDVLVIDPPIEHGQPPEPTTSSSSAPPFLASANVPFQLVLSHRSRRPVLAFLIHHKRLDKRILFDLSLFEEWQSWLGEAARGYQQEFNVEISSDGNLVQQLEKVGVEADDVDVVLLSHKHFDHTGRPSAFKNAVIWIHEDEKDSVPALRDVSAQNIKPFKFDAKDRKPVASFDDSLDLFGDESIVIVAVPGHTPGHVGALVRTERDKFVLLGADGCHHRLLLNGTIDEQRKYKLGCAKDDPMYEDYSEASKSLARLRRAKQDDNVLVVTAHDERQWDAWCKHEQKRIIDLNDWKQRGLKEIL
ncbi:hypothetical protein OIV83_003813 [Microbotryomycetes sp. JL201]|nr:hypothetical protein OIV83_003813 [Microbotryomycetes sp. JL201]